MTSPISIYTATPIKVQRHVSYGDVVQKLTEIYMQLFLWKFLLSFYVYSNKRWHSSKIVLLITDLVALFEIFHNDLHSSTNIITRL